MRNFKSTRKIVFALLAFLLVFSNGFIGLKGAKAESNDGERVVTSLTKQLNKKKLRGVSEENNKYKDSDVVRVIVELEGSPAIETATKQGVRYKDLSKTKQASLQNIVEKEQNNFISTIKDEKLNLTIENTFTTVVNGVSGTIEFGKIKDLEKLPNVSKVYIANKYDRPVVKPQMVTSKDQIGAKETWDLEYKGNGTVVGIIDTGIDSNHKDMILSEGTKPKLTKSSVSEIVSNNKMDGKFYTEKVPYGYNYADKNDNILDLGPDASMHGMHVAGTVAANGDEENDGIKGVAPEAQLLALKVFGNDPEMGSTFGDIYIKAIDDGIKLGADVLNMSLGSTAGFVNADDPEQQAVKRAVDNGVVMAISAGNSANFGNGYYYPYASNPDIGVIGSPGLSNESISVASIENSHINVDGIKYTVNGSDERSAGFISAGSKHPNDVEKKSFEVLEAGFGSPKEFEGQDFNGKYALVQRGNDIGFVDKALNAQKAGAAGVIIYNNQSGIVNMASDASIVIPQLFMLKSEGEQISSLIKEGKKIELTFTGKKNEIVNPSAGQMSDFTSWGVTPNLDFKPEITAPGGQIYSTLNNDQYGLMSGTSMAAPHVAGGSALVLQYVKEAFPDLTGAEKVNRAKTLLMNTAVPVVDPNSNEYYSPRRQGSGLMKLDAAVQTPVYVTKQGTNEGKVALKEIDKNIVSFTLTATNFSDKDVTYHVDTQPLTDKIASGFNLLTEQKIAGAEVNIDKPELTIPKGQSEDVTISIDLSKADDTLTKLMENGYFVEGFVTFTADESFGVPSLSVPYAGFKGDWNKPPILDGTLYDEDTFYGVSGMVDQDANYLGQDPFVEEGLFYKDKIAISPNNDGQNDTVTPVLSFLRNSKSTEYSILNENKEQIRKLHTKKDVRKNYYDAGLGSKYVYDPKNTTWDGQANNNVVPDGQYYYQVKNHIDYPGKEPQVVQIPVTVDSKAPEILSLKYNQETGELSIDATDERSGIQYFGIYINGESVVYAAPSEDNITVVNLPNLKDPAITVYAVDYAGNKAVSSTGNDGTIPFITVKDPEALTAFASKVVPFNGYVNDATVVKELTVKGDKLVSSPQKVALNWNEETKRYEFDTKIEFSEDGVQEISIEGVDQGGNHIEFKRILFIDSTPPTIDVKGLPANGQVDTNQIQLTANIADNFDELRFLVNGNEEYRHEFDEPFEMRSISHDVELNLPLEKGKNKFVLELEDLAGNVTKKEITIDRVDSGNPGNPDPGNPGGPGVPPVDQTAPDAPKVNEVSDQDIKVTGTAEKGSTIDVTSNGIKVGSGVVDENGAFSVSIEKQKAGTTLLVTAKDAAGNVSKATKVVVLDKTAPDAPSVSNVTSSTTKVTGNAEAGSKIAIKVGKNQIGSGTVNKDGKFSVSIKAQKAKTSLSVTATDKAGNVSKATTVQVKATPPSVKYASSTKVSGKAKAGAKVYVEVGSKVVGSSTVNNSGNFSVTIKNTKGGATLKVYAVENGLQSVAKTVKAKATPPSVKHASTTKVSGYANAGAKVYVKVGSKVVGSATVSKTGSFTVKMKKQKVGTTLHVYAVENGQKSVTKQVKAKK